MSDMLTNDSSWSPVTVEPRYKTYAQMEEEDRNVQASKSLSEATGAVLQDTQLALGGARALERQTTEFKPDPNFKLDDAAFDKLRLEFGEKDARGIVDGASSQEEIDQKSNWVREDVKRIQTLGKYGKGAMAGALLSSVLDPVAIGATFLAAPVAGAMKFGQVGRITRMIAAGAASNATMEAVMYAGDTQKGIDDVFYAAAFGGTLGGVIGRATRGRIKPKPMPDVVPTVEGMEAPIPKPQTPKGKPELQTVVEGADEFDRVATKAAKEAADYDMYMAARDNYRDGELDAALTIDNHINDLRKQSGFSMSRAEKAEVKASIRDTQARIDELEGLKVTDRAAEAAKRGAPANKAEALDLKLSTKAIASRYDADIKAQRLKLDELKQKMDSLGNVNAAKAELKEFTGMTPEQQRAKLGITERKVEPINVKQQVEDAIKGMRELRKLGMLDEVDVAAKQAEVKGETRALGEFDDETGGSIGAAKVKGAQVEQELYSMSERLEDTMMELTREANASPVKPIRLISTGSHIMSSKNPTMRGLGLRLLENSQGGAYHGKTASILSDLNRNVIASKGGNRYNDGFMDYLKDQGLSPLSALKGSQTDNFNKEIYTAIKAGITPDTKPSVARAAQGVIDQLEEGLKVRKMAGEAGFEDVKSAKDYIPTIFDRVKMAQVASKIGIDNTEAILSKGYQQGKYKLGKKTADAVAKMQVMRGMDANLSARMSFDRVVSQASRASFIDNLRASGVPDHVIQEFVESQELVDIANSVSNRARASMGIDTTSSVGGISVQDVLNTNVPELVENYTREAAAGAAMAKMGFPTRSSVMEVIDAAERTGRNMGLDGARQSTEAQALRDSVRLMYGESIDADPASGLVRNSRRLREVTSITRLNQMGFAQIPEIARVTVKMGLGAVLHSIPATKFLMPRRGRIGGVASGKLKEPELREIEQVVGYVGEDQWLHGWGTRGDELGLDSSMTQRLGAAVDAGLAAGGRANLLLSGFKLVQGASEKIAARSIAYRLKQHLDGARELPMKDLEEIGLGAQQMSDLKKFWDANPKFDKYEGQPVRMFNFDAMTPEMKETVGMAIRRMQGRLIQRHFVGDESVWMNKWWGKLLTQFKGFSIVSLEKQAVHDFINGDKFQAAQILGLSAGMAFVAYATQMQLQASGRGDGDKFLKEKFEPNNLAFGVFNKMPQTAALSLAGDALATFGLLPDSMTQASGRMGFNTMGAGELVPAAGMVGDYTDTIRAYADYVSGDPDTSLHQVVDKTRRAVPLLNAIGIGQALKAATDTLE